MEAITRALAARVREGLAAGGIDAARDPRAVRALIDRAIDTHAPDMLPTQREQVEADLMDDICGLGPLQVLMDRAWRKSGSIRPPVCSWPAVGSRS